MDQLIGQSLDRYQIMSIISQDDLGSTFLAQDIKLQQDVALKVVDPQIAADSAYEAHFLQQARIAARLNHPSVINARDFGQAHNWIYIVTDCLTDDTLNRRLADLQLENKWIPLAEATQLALQVCLAVDYLHQEGVMHRRISPGEIVLKAEALVDEAGETLPYRPILTDLGLTMLHQDGLEVMQSSLRETLAYMSPEQVLGQSLDARSDVYSLGVLLYLLTAGELPLKPESFEEAYRYHTGDSPPLLRSLRPDFVEPIEQIILKALARDPRERYPDVKSLAEALLEIRSAQLGVGALPRPTSETATSGALIVSNTPEKTSKPERDHIVVVAPDGTIKRETIAYQSITIGREANNEVILDDPRVSRQHTKLQLDGTDYRVTDLNSTNGTFLGDMELVPGVPIIWTPDQLMHIGNFQLRLERKESPSGRTVAMSPARISAGPGPGITSGEDLIGLRMDVTSLSVTPGNSVKGVLTIHNRGVSPDEFSITVSGVPTDWMMIPPPLKLAPGEKQQVAVTFRPPAVVQNRVGRYPVSFRVVSENRPDYSAEVEATLTIITYTNFSMNIEPQRLNAGKRGQVTIRNQGSLPETFILQWWDQSEDLVLEPSRFACTVPAGQVYPVDFQAAPRKKRWFGGQKEYPFYVQVTSETEDTQTQEGKIIGQGSIPLWAPVATVVPFLILIPLLLLCCVGAVFLFRRANQPDIPAGIPPIIRNIELDPFNPVLGQPIVIRWEVDYAKEITISPYVSGLNAGQGEYVISKGITRTTTIVFIASNDAGSVERSVVIPVILPTSTPPAPQPIPTGGLGSATPSTNAPVVASWSVSPTQITAGETVIIRWEVSNAESVSVKPFGAVGNVGEIQDTPIQNQTYALTAVNQDQTVERTQQVIVAPANPGGSAAPTVQTFAVEPDTIVSGQGGTVRLSWETLNADSVSIEPGIGLVGLSGFFDVTAPARDQTYILTARNANGDVQAQTRVTVR